jgi:hypothetical protein
MLLSNKISYYFSFVRSLIIPLKAVSGTLNLNSALAILPDGSVDEISAGAVVPCCLSSLSKVKN